MTLVRPATLTLIVAMSRNRVIGRDGRLPWRIPEDLRRFRQLTMGHVLLMGRLTFESIGKALPGRTNIVVSRQLGFVAPGCIVCPNLEAAMTHAYQLDPRPYVIGGASLYGQALGQTACIELTLIDKVVEGDTYFPELPPNTFTEVSRSTSLSDPSIAFIRLERHTHLATPRVCLTPIPC